MSYSPSDFYGDTNAREESDYHERMEAIADARDAARAAELAEEEAEAALELARAIAPDAVPYDAARDEAMEREAIIMREVFGDWRVAVTPPRYAAIGNGLFVRVGSGRKTRRAA